MTFLFVENAAPTFLYARSQNSSAIRSTGAIKKMSRMIMMHSMVTAIVTMVIM